MHIKNNKKRISIYLSIYLYVYIYIYIYIYIYVYIYICLIDKTQSSDPHKREYY